MPSGSAYSPGSAGDYNQYNQVVQDYRHKCGELQERNNEILTLREALRTTDQATELLQVLPPDRRVSG